MLFAEIATIYAKPFYFPISGAGGAGLYGDDDLLFAGRKYVEITGQVSSCGEYNKRLDQVMKEGVLVTDDSFCGYAYRRPLPIIYVSNWRVIDDVSLRLTGDEAAKKYGNLIEIENSWPDATEVRHFTEMVHFSATSPVKYFRRKLTVDEAKELRYVAFGCVCKSDDCTGQWPIASEDTSSRTDWPYTCIEIIKMIDSDGKENTLTLDP